MSEEPKAIAETILAQMGGAGRIRAMTGAKNFINYGDALSFQFPNKGTKNPNCVKITLCADDTYSVAFSRLGKKLDKEWSMPGLKIYSDVVKELSVHAGIYCDGLKSLFEDQTGLYLSL